MEKTVKLARKVFSVYDLVKEINFTYQNIKVDKVVEFDKNRKCINMYENGVKTYYAISFSQTGMIQDINPKIERYMFKWVYSYWITDYQFSF